MHQVLEWLGEFGVIPVVKIGQASDALPLGNALIAGDLPVAEITFRTNAAEESIRILADQCLNLLVGAGTVLTVEQARKAIAAGAKFIVAPGFNPKVVDFCIDEGVPVTPGVSTPTDIEKALEKDLEVLKFFPAGSLGGLNYLKAIAAPYGGVQFIPTGGVEPGNLREYLSFDRVHAVGGTWVAPEKMISAKDFGGITRLAKEAVMLSLDFGLAHLGINPCGVDYGEAGARQNAETMANLFSFALKDGTNSLFAGTAFEFLKNRGAGINGHIAISTLSVPRAIAFLQRRGVEVMPETAKERDGRIIAVNLKLGIADFAVHLLQK